MTRTNRTLCGMAMCAGLAFSSRLMGGELRLISLDPGHSHAAGVFARMLPGFSPEAHIYAPAGPDLLSFLDRVFFYNHRAADPAHWSYSVYAGPDYLERMLKEPPGNVVAVSGKNKEKINYILASIRAGQNVLADKPWIIDFEDFPKLEEALTLAKRDRVVAYDCMTLRFNVAYEIQRALVSDPLVFGAVEKGSASDPAVRLENLHALLKYSHGEPSHRPAWFFDIRQQGEGIADVGTHLVDLAFWTLFADSPIDYKTDIQVLAATRSPTVLTRSQFEKVTSEKAWPEFVRNAVRGDRLEYYDNNTVLFTVRGVHVRARSQWEYEAPKGAGDSYLAVYRGGRATIRLGAGAAEHYTPEVDVIPNPAADRGQLLAALRERLAEMNSKYSGLALREGTDGHIHIVIPDALRARDNGSFARLVDRFVGYIHDPNTMPSWETPNLLAKYYVTTKAVDLAKDVHKP